MELIRSLISIKLHSFLFNFSKASDGEIVVISDKASFTRVCDDLILILKYNIYCERNKNKEKKVINKKNID